ncbi:DUF3054 domain-containing protein [Herpetosiphon giganteus]|uniref:DUF3054 domain-containing protein n=1 Tax=Herpetosiphon giganteus TaxID=2029754 RepID=UPI00195F19A7|nr:DUF3054 domain-containing protein [Herpetosiphon giganteus]MBM7841806.1 Na+-transporting NADH:ubiquinone oxidoreductase subunit NqrB [Herpetosiphon giganteus]
MTTNQELSNTPDNSARVIGLIVGDVAIFALFVIIGRLSHEEGVNADAVINVAAPFVIGWGVAAPLLKLYTPAVSEHTKTALQRTALAWCVAAPIGLVLRSLVWKHDFKPGFAITTFIFNMILLLAWRGWSAYRAGKRSQ